MKTIRDRIISFLRQHPEGADDDELTHALSLRYRQQANSMCRQLAKAGLVERRVVDGKIRNFWKGQVEGGGAPTPEQRPIPTGDEPWFWEGNVQGSIAQFLIERGYLIIHLADPRRREKGKDIEAENQACPLLGHGQGLS